MQFNISSKFFREFFYIFKHLPIFTNPIFRHIPSFKLL